MKTILLKFAGPLQSWGTHSHFETLHTDFYPSKSAVIGLLAAALGYGRDEDEKIRRLNTLDFAVRIDQQGRIIKDFQTAKKYDIKSEFKKVTQAYVTTRYYIEDAVFLVALSSADEQLVTEIERALRRPYFQLFMGRRSVPVLADFLVDIVDVGAIEALKKESWQAARWFMKKEKASSVRLTIIADKKLLDKKALAMPRRDVVSSFSQKNRRFAYRYEVQIAVDLTNPMAINAREEHDIWEQLGE